MSAVEDLIAEHVAKIDRSVNRDQIHVYEDPHASDSRTLIVQIAARRPSDRTTRSRLQLRFSQEIRDALLLRGDLRYPLIEIFEPEEWAARND